jgi:DNA-binding NtrC family response regulator
VARHAAPVLLTGETGTGKELCAHAIHYLSPRAGKPFLPVNCGAIPVELFESEFFGHQRGAFTGASVAQPGLVKEAEGGTLFLDEIESLSLSAQVKLLRFIENHTYYSLGSAKPRPADVRIIAATNIELREKIRQGAFRDDLFYRLAVMNLHLPPLRQRRGDIPLLVSHFWSRYKEQYDGIERRLSPRAMEALCEYSWPGNVRELENVIQQLAVLSDAQTIEPADLPITVPVSIKPTSDLSFNQARAQIIASFEKTYLEQLLRFNHGNISRAAKEAKKDRRTFSRLIKKYQLGRLS